jgi:hypothetical protein
MRQKKKHRESGAFFIPAAGAAWVLLDLAFAEFDVLPGDRIVLLQHHLFGLRARVLLCNVEEAGIRRTDELDLDGGGLRHGITSELGD